MSTEANDAVKRLENEQAKAAIRFVDAIVNSARESGMPPAILIAALFEALGHLMCEDLRSAEAE